MHSCERGGANRFMGSCLRLFCCGLHDNFLVDFVFLVDYCLPMLDFDRRLMVLFSFTVKLVSKIMRASWGSLCDFPKVHPIDVIASGGMFLNAFSYVTAIIDGVDQHGNPYPHSYVA